MAGVSWHLLVVRKGGGVRDEGHLEEVVGGGKGWSGMGGVEWSGVG